jgi:purine-nucleoside phosphorylase
MQAGDPIVRPVRNNRSPVLGPLALLIASHLDLEQLAIRMQLPTKRQLYMSKLFFDENRSQRPALVGPIMGAPYAAMILEILRAWGVQKAVFIGWCGSIDAAFNIGDIVIPTSAVIDEGTSPDYMQPPDSIVYPDEHLCAALQTDFSANQIPFKKGRAWTTDAIYRETPEKLERYGKMGAHVVDMELSALYSAAAFHALPLTGILAVSDELFTLSWRPGFKEPSFILARNRICERIVAFSEMG